LKGISGKITLSTALTKEHVVEAFGDRMTRCKVLQGFENSKKRLKDLHMQRLRSAQALSRLASSEREYIKEAAAQTDGTSTLVEPGDGFLQGV
jgi:hypothetical protein